MKEESPQPRKKQIVHHRTIVGIMGSGKEPWLELVQPLAEWIAQQGFHLLTGGGNGVMHSASEAFVRVQNREGLCLGIMPTVAHPESGYVPKEGYPNKWVELSIISPLDGFQGDDAVLNRNYINVLTSHVIVALPGSRGTRNEVELAQRFHKPIILYGPKSAFTDFPPSSIHTSSLPEVQEFIFKNSK